MPKPIATVACIAVAALAVVLIAVGWHVISDSRGRDMTAREIYQQYRDRSVARTVADVQGVYDPAAHREIETRVPDDEAGLTRGTILIVAGAVVGALAVVAMFLAPIAARGAAATATPKARHFDWDPPEI
ncbi:MAG TPA: hypothetical protein VF188_14340 [Longimicrobiales bacterium]|jgi:hypothetical protein